MNIQNSYLIVKFPLVCCEIDNHLEDQMDIMVYKLHNLTYEEIKIIGPEVEKIVSKEAYERFEI